MEAPPPARPSRRTGAGRVLRGAAVVLLLLALPACAGPDAGEIYHFTRFSMGTVVEYAVVAPSPAAARDAVTKAHAEMERVSRLLWEDDSLSQVYALNRTAGRIDVPEEVGLFLQRAGAYHATSGGAFDVTIKPVLDLYGFEDEQPRPPSPEALQARLALVGMDHLRLLSPTSVEKVGSDSVAVAVGGVAKGYAVDRAVRVLREEGIAHAIVNAGGDLYCLGTSQGGPWAVGIRSPDDPAVLIDTLYVADRAVATSGDYQRYFVYEGRRYHHLLNPADGRPVRTSRSATVIAETAEQADALATTLFVAGPRRGIALLDSLPGVEGMVMDSNGAVFQTRGYGLLSTTPAR